MENKFKAIAVDDEQHCIDTLLWELERHCPEVQVVASYTDADDAFEVLQDADIDILFLDIHLQSTSGIALLERLQPVDYHVIFVTAYDEYAIKAFDLAATHYLLKPINGKLLRSAVDRIEQIADTNVDMKALISKLKQEITNVKKIALPIQTGVEFVAPENILYVEGDNNYSNIFMLDGSKLLISKTLAFIEETLSDFAFIRIHKSYLINGNYLKRYNKRSGASVELENGITLPVSRMRKAVLNELFK